MATRILFSSLHDARKQELCRIQEYISSLLPSGAEAIVIHLGVKRWLGCAGVDLI